jgi:hypothetical protein
MSETYQKEFHLEKTDKEFEIYEDPTMITVRQATEDDIEAREALLSKTRKNIIDYFIKGYVEDETEEEIEDHSFLAPLAPDIELFEVYWTLCACNITSEGGKKPLFKFENGRLRDEVEFRAAWSKLEPIIADEIHEKVLEMNPEWKGERERISGYIHGCFELIEVLKQG